MASSGPYSCLVLMKHPWRKQFLACPVLSLVPAVSLESHSAPCVSTSIFTHNALSFHSALVPAALVSMVPLSPQCSFVSPSRPFMPLCVSHSSSLCLQGALLFHSALCVSTAFVSSVIPLAHLGMEVPIVILPTNDTNGWCTPLTGLQGYICV
ncbi:hypothetical protein AVEN_198034-1 [Araneus ventricosus]|uniref:Uncharacterized protein n=1 Tax=Araneus ventricosus TaxID=182803 RepID=A0A4Y2GLR0_ARAVE|nr:hypothetical protein AVEN_198034-1 [Araneus ventricosus]